MTSLMGYGLSKALILALVLFAIYQLATARITRTRRRTNDLRMAAHALEDHYEAAKRLLDNEATPDFILEAVEAMEARQPTHATALKIAELLCRSEETAKNGNRIDDANFDRMLHELRVKQRDVYDDFTDFAVAGAYSIVMRWPDTAKMLHDRFGISPVEAKREVFVSQALNLGRREHSNAPVRAMTA